MRLERIKLAGFKSFVDPTVVHFPSNLVGIVGPNGCGKSNVIDAVRWVMGESSAKMLRGESMADVIFNGSTSRKPVGTATIELIFDNSDGRAGGQYVAYNQISVKRQVSRDGQSVYFLNGTRCRRRDITDLFLGTGLGPRSYSIIEQGMISRLIEARPEELRVFLEEAAGISKYKERRRETENRIRHTRENLDRLDDLREELAKQLRHLERQAETAEKYSRLKQQERRLSAELLALRWQELDRDIQRRDREIAGMELALEAALTEQRRLEAGIEADRERHLEASDGFNEVQGRYYAVGAEIARLEQAIQYVRETGRRQERELQQLEGSWHEAEAHRHKDQARLEELECALRREQPLLETVRAREAEAVELLASAEREMNAWQEQWEGFNHKAAEPAQAAQVERARINQMEKQIADLQDRRQRLEQELGRLDNPLLEQEIQALEIEEAAQRSVAEELEEQSEDAAERIRSVRSSQGELARRLDEMRTELQSAKGQRASLEALQRAALESGDSGLRRWLQSNGLDEATRLVRHLRVEAPWQRAVEVVLGQALQSLCTEDLAGLGPALEALDNGPLALFDTAGSISEDAEWPADSLLSRVRSPWRLDSLLGGARTVDSLDEALARRSGLVAGESLITPAGQWVGRDWLRVDGRGQAESGVIARSEELEGLEGHIQVLEGQASECAALQEQARERLHGAESERDGLQRELDRINRSLSDIRSRLTGKRTRLEHLLQRRQSIVDEQERIASQSALAGEDIVQARSKLHAALEEMEALSHRREVLVRERDGLRERLALAREMANRERNEAHRLALQLESLSTARQSVIESLARLAAQLAQLRARTEELEAAIAEAVAPLAGQQSELERQLSLRVEVERALADMRDRLEGIDTQLREAEQQRHRVEQRVQERRERLNQARLQRQEVLVRWKTLAEQLQASDFSREELLAELPTEAAESEWQARLEKMAQRIQRLGAINLAAIDEFQQQQTRMQYLNEQHADITRSLDTLEEAIRKIDRETRSRFKDTFERVNTGLQGLFPRLFGGGHAYLELTGEDLLDTGVTVMARPPGKRNSSIHQLSGGEKALTAVALVFAIFQLNPAPFCMLDEVDAPLDDANVGRFCELVTSMSDQVQFIFITHNKVTMEISHQLSGVTMHEPGVSRLVSVDVEEAAQLVAV